MYDIKSPMAIAQHIIVFSLVAVLYCDIAVAQFIHFQPFSLDHFNGTVLTDGVYELCTNPFNTSFETFSRVALRNRNRALPLTLSGNVVVVDINGRRIMVDTGVQLHEIFRNGGQLLKSMQAAGITPESIDIVVLTHAHPDHFLGLSKGNQKTFPNAVVYISKVDHQFWSDPNRKPGGAFSQEDIDIFRQLYLGSVQPYIDDGKFRLLNDMEPIITGVSIRLTPGHTPGHANVEFHKGSSLFSVVGDMWHFRDLQFRNIGIGFNFDTNSTQAAESRKKILRMLVKRRDLVLAYHENFPGLGYIRKRNKYGFDWVFANIGDLQANLVNTCDPTEMQSYHVDYYGVQSITSAGQLVSTGVDVHVSYGKLTIPEIID